jgi:hypothetical protein
MCNRKSLLVGVLFACVGVAMPAKASVAAPSGTDQAQKDESIELRTLVLVPASEPAQALKVRLLPTVTDQKNGNAALLLHTAAELYPDQEGGEDIQKKVQAWLDLPIDQVPMAEANEVLARFNGSFHQIELASLRDRSEWEMPLEDGFAMLMPGLSTYRHLAWAMSLKLRIEVSRGQSDRALQTLRHGLSMGRNVAGQTLIQDLVGTAITSVMLKEIESMLQRADYPNLYWALTALPVPWIDLRRAIESEEAVLLVEFPGLRNLDQEVMTPEQASRLVNGFWSKVMSLMGSPEVPLPKVTAMGWVLLHYTDAKAYLAAKGMTHDRIEAMPAAQAVMLYQLDTFREMRDRLFKWFSVPYPVAQPHLKQAGHEVNRLTQEKGIKANLFAALLPALSRVAFLQARLDRQVAMLRTIEAIRLYAADHGSQLPQTLEAITAVPVPLDPVTGRAFLYQVTDSKVARLEAPKTDDETKKRPVYELTLKP